jgi:hypothetical protein
MSSFGGKADIPISMDIQFIWSICGGDISCDEELSFCGMLHNGSRHSPKSTTYTAAHSRG